MFYRRELQISWQFRSDALPGLFGLSIGIFCSNGSGSLVGAVTMNIQLFPWPPL